MDYKSVLEEQIRELQKVQDATVKKAMESAIYVHSVCEVATVIKDLVITVAREI